MAKTFIACRPGMQATLQAQFAGVDVVVDEALTKDYEFRERELTFSEIMEEELEKEERQEADPKNAVTLIVPCVLDADAERTNDDWYSAQFLAIRIERGPSIYDLRKIIKDVKPVTTGDFPDEYVNIPATMGALKSALKKAGHNVLSISEADGIDLMASA